MEIQSAGFNSGTLLFFETMAFNIIWWFSYLAAEPLFRKVNPALYNRLKEEGREKRLIPFILFSMRIFYGLLITFPACTYAGLTAPWGHGVPLNRAGEVCMASQVTVWSTELGLLLPFSFELFLHHIICLVVTANVVWSPAVHPIRPIYILFATQLGDLPPCGIILLKMMGRKPNTSKLLYGFTLATTGWILGSKVTAGLWATGNSLTNPHRVGDWIWAFCLLFWVAYCLLTAYKNLKWLQIIKTDPLRPYSVVICDRMSVSISRLALGFGFSTTILSILFIYGINHEKRLTQGNINSLAIFSALGTAIGLTSAMGLRVLLPVKAAQTDPWGRDLYIQYAMLIVRCWAYHAVSSIPDIGPKGFMAALALNVPLFQAMAKISHYISAQDAVTRYLSPDPESNDEKPIPAAPTMAQLPKNVIRGHIGTAHANFAIYFISVALLSCGYFDITQSGTLALVAFLLSQLLRSPGMIYDSLNDTSSVAPFLHAVLSCVGVVFELSILIYGVSGRQRVIKDIPFRTLSSSYTLILGGTIAASFAVEFILKPRKTLRRTARAKKENGETLVPKAKKKYGEIMSPAFLTCLATGIAQVIIGTEVIRYSGPQAVAETGIGFTNFVYLLNSPKIWAAVAAAGLMPTLLLKIMDMEVGRAYKKTIQKESLAET